MAKIHVLESDGNGNFKVVIHTPMPGGNNSAGNSWQSVWVAAGRNVSVLPEGNGVGQISSAELADVVAGNVIELRGNINAQSGGATASSLNDLVDQIVADQLGRLGQVFKFYGYTQNAQA